MDFTLKLKLPIRSKITLAIRHKSYTPKTNIIEKYCEGVIKEIEDSSTGERKYAVYYNGIFYNILKECYNTDKKRKVYIKDSNNRYIEYDRVIIEDRKPLLNAIPFIPEMVCKGSIIEQDNEYVFRISACWKMFDKETKDKELKKLDKL